jgi:hypothetical protein
MDIVPIREVELELHGSLRDSLTQPNADGAIRQAHAQAAEFGTSVPYARAAAHKKGKPVLMNLVPELAELSLQYVMRAGEL